jgi:hypothetical protein
VSALQLTRQPRHSFERIVSGRVSRFEEAGREAPLPVALNLSFRTQVDKTMLCVVEATIRPATQYPAVRCIQARGGFYNVLGVCHSPSCVNDLRARNWALAARSLVTPGSTRRDGECGQRSQRGPPTAPTRNVAKVAPLSRTRVRDWR